MKKVVYHKFFLIYIYIYTHIYIYINECNSLLLKDQKNKEAILNRANENYKNNREIKRTSKK